MYVIDVIPLSRTAPGVLTYRSKEELPVGTIVTITIRKTETQGIVINSMPVSDAKEMLKHARFLLSKSVPAASGKLPDVMLRAAEKTAEYHATTSGSVLAQLASEHIKAEVPLPTDALSEGNGFERITCEQPIADRAAQYESRIRSCIESGSAAILIAPTIPELSYWKDRLRVFKPLILSGTLPGTKRTGALLKAASYKGLIIATPSFSWVPVKDLGLAIVDRVSSGTYTLLKRPYLSIPVALEALMKERQIPFVLGDFPFPLEYRAQSGTGIKSSFAPVRIIDARRKKDEPESVQTVQAEDVPWAAIPQVVIDAIQKEIKGGGRAIVLTSRKGYAPAVVCRDCGQAQVDERGMPYSFSQANGQRIFRTSDGHTIPAARKCQRCESWNLLPLGVGIERAEEELRAALPKAAIVSLPSESLSTPKKARLALVAAEESGTIVIGTEALLPWLYAGIQKDSRLPLGVIASADSLLSQPFWRARERFVRLAYFLQGLCSEVMLVTRHPEDTAVSAIADPSSPAFWQEETALRKILSYPPYGTLITLSVEGSEKRVLMEIEQLSSSLHEYNSSVLPPYRVQGALWRSTLILSRLDGEWPNNGLLSALRALPPSVRIRIDPESIW